MDRSVVILVGGLVILATMGIYVVIKADIPLTFL